MASIHPITVEELREMESKIFPYFEHMWREPYEAFLNENKGCTYFHADAGEGVQIIYCPAKDRGIWFVPKSGLGPLQEKGLKIMKEACEKK